MRVRGKVTIVDVRSIGFYVLFSDWLDLTGVGHLALSHSGRQYPLIDHRDRDRDRDPFSDQHV